MLLGFIYCRVAMHAWTKVTKLKEEHRRVKKIGEVNNVMASDGGVSVITRQVECHGTMRNNGE